MTAPPGHHCPSGNGIAKIYKICHLANDNRQNFSRKISNFICNAGKIPKTPFSNTLIINQDDNFQKCGFPKTIFSKFMAFIPQAWKNHPELLHIHPGRRTDCHIFITKDNKIPEHPKTPEMPQISIISTPDI